MSDQEKLELERVIHRELRGLPEPKAPETLVHRVMLAVHARERAPWWQRSWLAWPFGFQLVSLIVLLFSAGLVSYLLGAAWDGVNVASIWQRVIASLAWLQPFAEVATALANAVVIICRAANPLWLLGAAGIIAAAYLVCIGLGTVCVRVAFKRG